ncbi:MAG TPA: NAD(P)/FAD-dependent oxidoreductase [Bacillota bacterium]|nr:NAD(P)/FAD-dependent oxidoreductase [Bacillota bacterium]
MYDVIIAGAGPSGSTLACRLAGAGMEVLVLEKDQIPREKPCGGGVTYKTSRLFDFSWQETVEDTVRTVIFNFRGKGEVKVDSPLPVAYMVMRRNFDRLLAERARAAGAVILEGTALKEITAGNGGVLISAGGKIYRGKLFAGADGVNGRSARQLGLYSPKETGPTLEVEIECSPEILGKSRGTIKIDCGAAPWGYGWIFPKKNHLSTGVGAFMHNVKGLRRHLHDFLHREGLGGAKALSCRGYPIPIGGGRKKKIHAKSAILLGDAAGLVDPFCGEGIYYVIKSAYLAAQAILDNATSLGDAPGYYQELVDRQITAELAIARRLARIFYTFPSASFNLIERRPEIAEQMIRIVYGEGNFSDLKDAALQVIRNILSMKRTSRA